MSIMKFNKAVAMALGLAVFVAAIGGFGVEAQAGELYIKLAPGAEAGSTYQAPASNAPTTPTTPVTPGTTPGAVDGMSILQQYYGATYLWELYGNNAAGNSANTQGNTATKPSAPVAKKSSSQPAAQEQKPQNTEADSKSEEAEAKAAETGDTAEIAEAAKADEDENLTVENPADIPEINVILDPDAALEEALDTDLQAIIASIIGQVTDDTMTQEEKLKACYLYVVNNMTYERTYDTPTGAWTKPYALQILTTGKGNCYRYAAAFAYLAKGVGYNTKAITGVIGAARGGYNPHGWVEVNVDGVWYICDPEMQYADKKKKKRDFFMKTAATYPCAGLTKKQEWNISL